MENNAVKKREANLELLRIIAMIMVITLHYLGKGNALVYYEYFGNKVAPMPNIITAWFLEAICYGATNIYVLISGYFMVTSTFRVEKGIKLWLQIFFYSAGIFLIFSLLGKVPQDISGIYWLGMFFTPSASRHYWFATIYLIFYLFSPFLALLARKLKKNQLLVLIISLVLIFSKVWGDILPFSNPMEDQGMGIAWFVTLFFIAAYIRLYVPEIKKKWIPVAVFVLCAVVMVAALLGFGFIETTTGHLKNRQEFFYHYNSIPVLLMSVSAFLFFRSLKIKEGFFAKAICKIAGLTFGVYLIHEHFLLRDLWTTLWDVPFHFDKPYFIVHLFVTVLAVFTACAIIEFVRLTVFNLIYKIKPVKWIFAKLSVIDKFFPTKNE